MRSTLGLLVWKEATELRRDRKVVLLAIVMPAILYPFIMSLTGGLAEKREEELSQQLVRVGVVGELPELEAAFADIPNMEFERLSADLSPDSLSALLRAEEPSYRALLDLRAGWTAAEGEEDAPALVVYSQASNEESREAGSRLSSHLVELRAEERQRRWEAAGGRGELGALIRQDLVDIASESASAGASTGRLLVYLLLFTIFGAGSAVAMEMVAGEKERGTLETLFLIPLNRSHIARAKLIVATGGTVLAGVMMVTSMAVSYRMGWIPSEGASGALSAQALAAILLLVIPLAVLAAGILLLISAWVRSLKEGQHYQLPAMFLFFIPAVLSTSQIIQLNPVVAMIPIANVSLAMRDVLIGTAQPGMLALVVVSTLLWAAASLKGVTALMSREAIVLGFDPEPVFAQSDGGRLRAIHFGMILGLLAFFYVGQWMQSAWMLRGVTLSLWLLVPAIAAGVYAFATQRDARGIADLREVLSLRLPDVRWFLAALLLAAGAMLPIAKGLWSLQARFLPAPELLPMAGLEDVPVTTLFLLLAVTPAVTEELLYRGVCLGLLRRRLTPLWAIGFSAIYFSAMHLSVFRILPTLTLGILFGWLTLRSRSLFPSMLCHLIYNGGLVVGAWYAESHELPIDPTGAGAWTASIAALGLGLWLASGLGEAGRARQG